MVKETDSDILEKTSEVWAAYNNNNPDLPDYTSKYISEIYTNSAKRGKKMFDFL